MEIKNTKWINGAILLVALFIGLYFFLPTLSEGPKYMHAWAQADRLAIAQGFVDNGFDFFHPQSFVYNHEYQLNYGVIHETTITAVDFPLHEYIVGLLMWIFGTKSPWVFHFYSFAISLAGIYALIRISELFKLNIIQRFTIVLFAITTPIFIFYQSNLLINVGSLSYFIIGFYNFVKWQQTRVNKPLFIGLIFMLIAALTRTTFIIGILALIGSMLIDWLKTKRTYYVFWISVLVLLIVFVSSQFYKYHLKETYGSIFLTTLLLPKSIAEYFSNIELAISKWWNYYFTEGHYLVLITIGFITLIKFGKSVFKDFFSWTFILFWMLGCLLFSIVLSTQFIEHNYYFFDTFYFPLLLIFILLIIQIESKLIVGSSIAILIFAFLFLSIPRRESMRETGDWDYATQTYSAYYNSEEWLDSIGIEKDAKILAFDAYTPNSPFIGMQRKGFAVNSYSPEILDKVLQWNYDYVTYQNNFFLNHLYAAEPNFIGRFERIATNGEISICKKRKESTSTDLLSFLGLNSNQILVETSILNDTSKWRNVDSIGMVRADQEFGPTYDFTLNSEQSIIYFNGVFNKNNQDYKVILTLSENDQLLEYVTYSPTDFPQKGEYTEILVIYNVPNKLRNVKGNVYIYNQSGKKVMYEDLTIKIYNPN